MMTPSLKFNPLQGVGNMEVELTFYLFKISCFLNLDANFLGWASIYFAIFRLQQFGGNGNYAGNEHVDEIQPHGPWLRNWRCHNGSITFAARNPIPKSI